jgi:hypothetical protein
MRRRKSNRNKYLFIATLLLVIVVIAAFAILFSANGEKPLASQYLSVKHTASQGYYLDLSNTTIVITTLGLNVTAVGGDVTGLQVLCKSQAIPEDAYLDSLAKGKTWDLPIALTGGNFHYRGLLAKADSQGTLQITVTISCNEARSATVPVTINLSDVYITGPGQITNP